MQLFKLTQDAIEFIFWYMLARKFFCKLGRDCETLN